MFFCFLPLTSNLSLLLTAFCSLPSYPLLEYLPWSDPKFKLEPPSLQFSPQADTRVKRRLDPFVDKSKKVVDLTFRVMYHYIMKIVKYEILLSESDRKRHTHHSDRGEVISFTVQFETLVKEKWLPVVRYDTAHGYAHKDILHLDGLKEKVDLGPMTMKDALVAADRNINENWLRYKKRFLKE